MKEGYNSYIDVSTREGQIEFMEVISMKLNPAITKEHLDLYYANKTDEEVFQEYYCQYGS